MNDAERETMLQQRIMRLIDAGEYAEAAEMVAEYCAVRARQGKIVPPEERRSPCEECPEREVCDDAWEVSHAGSA